MSLEAKIDTDDLVSRLKGVEWVYNVNNVLVPKLIAINQEILQHLDLVTTSMHTHYAPLMF